LNKYAFEYVVAYNNEYYFLKDEDELKEFTNNPQIYYNYLNTIKKDVRYAIINSYEDIALINIEKKTFEYQSCCPLTVAHDKQMINGKLKI
jgi:hypothetical protein